MAIKLHIYLAFLTLLIGSNTYSQGYDDDDLGPKVDYGIRLSLSTPNAWLKLNPPFNLAATFDRKKSFFLAGIDFWVPENRATDTTTSWLAGLGFQFSYGRYLSNLSHKGFYLIYNLRYQDTFEHWRGRDWVQGPNGGYSAPPRHHRLDYETYESTLGFGIKIPFSNRFHFDVTTGAGVSINIDYAKSIAISLQPSFQARGGIGYTFK